MYSSYGHTPLALLGDRDELISTPPKLPCKDTLFTRFAPSLVVCAANFSDVHYYPYLPR
ncbi:hypothetical protein HMPREF3185_00814 [Porphyromonas somerae]|uniref:Uncharacterized protein n=1 Tax=Porphyromonas somerae TaxID=322095 RepID=A0A134B9T2_9PORP|nr:hypothetical protein HMPREF3184_00814 [Porphyromonadaceae bacterium KA00676]KXB76703.1 hypothetical protein HMPREF3185_00814 [Porphyromonas somerae]